MNGPALVVFGVLGLVLVWVGVAIVAPWARPRRPRLPRRRRNAPVVSHGIPLVVDEAARQRRIEAVLSIQRRPSAAGYTIGPTPHDVIETRIIETGDIEWDAIDPAAFEHAGDVDTPNEGTKP